MKVTGSGSSYAREKDLLPCSENWDMPIPTFLSGEGWISAGAFLEDLKDGTWISTWVIGLRFGGAKRDFRAVDSPEAGSRLFSGVRSASAGAFLEALKAGTSTSA